MALPDADLRRIKGSRLGRGLASGHIIEPAPTMDRAGISSGVCQPTTAVCLPLLSATRLRQGGAYVSKRSRMLCFMLYLSVSLGGCWSGEFAFFESGQDKSVLVGRE